MLLRQRKEKVDIEGGGGGGSDDSNSGPTSEIMSKNVDLESSLSTLKTLLDISRRKEKKYLAMLHDAGLLTGIDTDYDSSTSQSYAVTGPAFKRMLIDRSSWLIGLLICQSLSSYILAYNETVLKSHPSVVFFLTMLVGAGGNAGNQATVIAIRGIATGQLSKSSMSLFILSELAMAMALSLILGVFGYLRVFFLSSIAFFEALVITASLMVIVLLSVVIGSLLPLCFFLSGLDPVNASTSIQVIMDVAGVIITCAVAGACL